MSIRGPVVRVFLAVGLLAAGLVAVAGGLTLGGSGLVAVAIAGALAGCLAAGMVRESPGAAGRSVLEAAAQAAGWTVLGLLVITGTVVLGGGVVAAVVVAAAGSLAVGIALIRSDRPGRKARTARKPARPAPTGTTAVTPITGAIGGLTTKALGREWTRTNGLLAGRLDPSVRAALVHRRQETLDELERRDPAGFARWLAAGPVVTNNPADYVHGERTAGTDAA